MSGIQRFTPKVLPHSMMSGHDWRKSGNPPPNNYFKSREMNMNECAAFDDPHYNSFYYYQEPDYSHNDYTYYNNDYSPDYAHDFHNNYNPHGDDCITQVDNSSDDRDFREDKILQKQK